MCSVSNSEPLQLHVLCYKTQPLPHLKVSSLTCLWDFWTVKHHGSKLPSWSPYFRCLTTSFSVFLPLCLVLPSSLPCSSFLVLSPLRLFSSPFVPSPSPFQFTLFFFPPSPPLPLPPSPFLLLFPPSLLLFPPRPLSVLLPSLLFPFLHLPIPIPSPSPPLFFPPSPSLPLPLGPCLSLSSNFLPYRFTCRTRHRSSCKNCLRNPYPLPSFLGHFRNDIPPSTTPSK